MRLPACLLLAALILLPCTRASAALGKLGAMGDSLTDEYWDSGVSTYASNWVSLIVLFRGIDMGPTAAQAGTNSWGSPRNLGYKYNWALTGATSADLLSEGQHTGLASQFSSDGVSNAVQAIGANDFNPETTAYASIYFGTWTAGQIQTYVNQSISNIENALSTVRASGQHVVVATLIDPGSPPAATAFYTSAANRDRVNAAIQTVNAGVKNLAQKYQVPLVDWYSLAKAILGPNTSLHSTLKVGNVTINLRASDPGPPNSAPTNAFVSDGFHPNTVFQGIFANTVLQAFNSGYNANVALFTEQELLNHAQITYGGSDTLQSQLGSYTNYIILPTPTKFTAINVAGSNIALQFSTVSNQFYLVETSTDLTSGLWTTLTNNMPGTGGLVTVSSPLTQKAFFHLRQLP